MTESQHSQQFNQLYKAHYAWVYAWLYKKLGNSADAADIAQDTFLRVLAKTEAVDIRYPRAYLSKIAASLSCNFFHRKSIERAYLEVLAQQPDRDSPSPEQQLMIIETLTEVIHLLFGLPESIRDSFIYAQLERLNHQQIADKLNISVSTVKRNIQRAYIQCLTVRLDEAEDL